MAVRGLRVHVLDLLHRPGSRRVLHDAVPLAPMIISSARVPEGADVAYDLILEAQGSQVIVMGDVSAPWVGDCRRCLEPTTGTVETHLREVFERDAKPGETWPIAGDQIDLEPVVVEAILLELPLAPLCGPDCLGPAPDRFPTSIEPDETDQPVGETPIDPRWAALGDLEFD